MNIEIKINKEEFRKKLNVKDGKDGKTPTKMEIINLIKPLIPQVKDGENGKNGSPDSGDEIISKINKSNKLIDVKRVKGLKEIIDTVDQIGNNMGGGGRRGDVLIYKDLTSLADGSTNTFNVTGITKILGVFSTQFPGGGFRPFTDWTYSNNTAILTLDVTQVGPIQAGQTLWALCASI